MALVIGGKTVKGVAKGGKAVIGVAVKGAPVRVGA